MKVSKSGFTIVELLIVIVVIAILAAITIVAFNGIQERSRNVKTITATKQYIAALKMYAADNGKYPDASPACIGEGYSYEGIANRCGGNVNIRVSSGFDTSLSQYLSSKPQLDTTNLIISSSNVRSGGYYDRSVGAHGVVYYLLAGTTGSCDAGGVKTLSAGPEVTGFFCTYSLQAP